MNFNFGSPMETMPGSDAGSTYFVIAKNKGLKAGLRIFMSPYKIKDSVWVALSFRIRVEAEGFNVNSEMAQERFGAFSFYESKGHASCVGVLPLVALPTSPAEVYTHYTKQEGKVEEKLVDMLVAKMEKAGATVAMSKEDMVVTLREKVADLIPEISVTVNDTPEFLLLNQLKKPE